MSDFSALQHEADGLSAGLPPLMVQADHLAASVSLGVHGLCPLGSVGCLPYLGDDERQAVIRTTVTAAAGRVPVLAGVSSLSTAQTVRHARFAQEAGALSFGGCG